MPLLGLLLFLHIKIDTTSQLIELVSMPLLGLLLFLPYPLGKNPYFPSLPSVFIFSALFRKFLAYIAYIGTFLHLHNLNKAISHIFSKKILSSCSPLCYPALSFLVKVLKLHRPYKRHSTELFSASLCLSLLAISLLPFSCPNFGVHMALQNPVKKCDIVIFFQSFYI